MLKFFVMSLLKNDDREAGQILNENQRKLVDYLRVKFELSQEDAEDAIHNTVLILLERSEAGSLQKLENSVAYTYAILRNESLRIKRNGRRFLCFAEENREAYYPARQLEELERNQHATLVKGCLAQMNEFNRTFFMYFMDNPDCSCDEVAAYFGIKKHSVYTRKHRLQHALTKCLIRKLSSPYLPAS